jgi:hypothetical protein
MADHRPGAWPRSNPVVSQPGNAVLPSDCSAADSVHWRTLFDQQLSLQSCQSSIKNGGFSTRIDRHARNQLIYIEISSELSDESSELSDDRQRSTTS